MDRRAQLFAIDLLLAFIPITIMLGMSANAISGVAFQIQDYSNIYSLNRRADDALDVLVKTPGIPLDWNDTNPPSTIGLAQYDSSTGVVVPNKVNSTKINWANTSDFRTLTGTDSFYLNFTIVIPSNYSTISYTWGSQVPDNAVDVVVVDRYVNFVFSSDFGPFLEAVGVLKETTDSPECNMGSLGLGGAGCVYDSISGLDTTNADFYLYIESTGNPTAEVILSGGGTDNITYFKQSDFNLCNSFKSCDNTEENDCKLSGPNPTYTVYSKFIWNLTDGTVYTPSSGNPLTSAPGYANCNSVSKATAIVPLPDGFTQSIDYLEVRTNGASGEPLDVYGVKVPTGLPWNLVSPVNYGDTPYFAKLTLKMWRQ